MIPLNPTALLATVLLVAGCVPDSAPIPEGETAVQGDARLWASPASGSPGLTRTVTIWGEHTDFLANETSVDFGAGISTLGVLVDSSFRLRATVLVADEAPIGPRDVTVSWPEGQRILRDGFVVETGSIELTPRYAGLGETLTLDITGWDTEFTPGLTNVTLGPGITLPDPPEVLGPSRLRVVALVDPRAEVGARDLYVANGPVVWTLKHAFHVDRSDRVMRITPDVGTQSTVMEVRIEAEQAEFVPEETALDLGTGIVVEQVTVIDSEHLGARIRIGNNARVGPRDVSVESLTPSGPRTRLLLDGFTVEGVPSNPLRARVSLSFSISRTWQDELCFWDERVSATALFYEPNDFPCPSNGGSSSLSVPPRFDLVGTGYSSPETGSTDCPSSKTFDAGPFVSFVADGSEVVLSRDYDPITARVVYQAVGLPLEAYLEDTAFSLVTTGGDLGFSELPAWDIPEAIRTMPRDFEQTAPDYCALSHPLDQPLGMRWTPGGTYDSADMYAYIFGPPTADGTPLMYVYPWDDGAWDFDDEALSFFGPGPAQLIQVGTIRSRFEVPGSEYPLAGIGSSSILWRGTFMFE